MATPPLVYGRGRTSNSWRETLPYFGTRIRKDLVVEKGAISPDKVPLPMNCPAWRETQMDFPQSRQFITSTGTDTSLA